jgi:hypothetical protein
MRTRLKEVVPHAVMLCAAVALYWAAGRIDVETGGRISPAAWPKAIVAIMALLCLYEIVKRLVASHAGSATGLLGGLQGQGKDEHEGPPEHPRQLFGGIALIAAYVLAVPWLGFFVTTALFLAAFPWIGGLRRPVVAASVALAGSLALIVIFMRVAYISLPLGAGPFRSFSIALLRALGVS